MVGCGSAIPTPIDEGERTTLPSQRAAEAADALPPPRPNSKSPAPLAKDAASDAATGDTAPKEPHPTDSLPPPPAAVGPPSEVSPSPYQPPTSASTSVVPPPSVVSAALLRRWRYRCREGK